MNNRNEKKNNDNQNLFHTTLKQLLRIRSDSVDNMIYRDKIYLSTATIGDISLVNQRYRLIIRGLLPICWKI